LVAWVLVPTLSASADTELYIYFNNAGIGNQEDAAGVWANGYKMVQHMADDPSGAAPQLIDSTTYGNNGTSGGTMTPGDLVTGKIGSAVEFDGINDVVNFGNDSSLNVNDTGMMTMGGWFYLNALPVGSSDYTNIIGKTGGSLGTTAIEYLLYIRGGSYRAVRPHVFQDTGNSLVLYDSTTDISASAWVYIVQVADGSTLKVYINGVADAMTAGYDGTIKAQTGNVYTADDTRGPEVKFMNGVSDELRITNVPHSADWIQTEFNNQSSPDTFHTIGALEAYSTGEANVGGGIDPTITFTLSSTSCNLGVIGTSTPAICSYSFNTSTNATSGMNVSLSADGDLKAGSDVFDEVPTGSVASSTFNAYDDFEAYGVIISSLGSGLTAMIPWSTTNYVDLPKDDAAESEEVVVFSAGPLATNDTELTHAAIASSITPAGTYRQTVTFSATTNF
jgi:hypothetical protein